jgi:hypothetical protein
VAWFYYLVVSSCSYVLTDHRPIFLIAGAFSVVLGLALAMTGLLRRMPDLTDDHLAEIRSAIAADQRLVSADVLREMLTAATDSPSAAPSPADISFVATSLTWRPAAKLDGSLSGINDYFQNIADRRLSIVGEAGGGKTLLARQFTLDLLKSGDGSKVPVWLDAAGLSFGGASLAVANRKAQRRAVEQWIVDAVAGGPGRSRKPVPASSPAPGPASQPGRG